MTVEFTKCLVFVFNEKTDEPIDDLIDPSTKIIVWLQQHQQRRAGQEVAESRYCTSRHAGLGMQVAETTDQNCSNKKRSEQEEAAQAEGECLRSSRRRMQGANSSLGRREHTTAAAAAATAADRVGRKNKGNLRPWRLAWQ